MKISNDSIATFTKDEVKLIVKALKVQLKVKSNSAGDQTGLDTPGIDSYYTLLEHVKKTSSVDLKGFRNLNSADYATEVYNDLKYYVIYADSMNILKDNEKKLATQIQKRVKPFIKK